MGEFSHSSPNPDSCCLLTLLVGLVGLFLMLASATGVVWLICLAVTS